MKTKSFWILTISMVLVKLLIHFLTSSNYELHRDEMLYFSMGNHLSWGYASTPPFISFLAAIIRVIFGYNELFVKLFPALFGAGIIVLLALFVRELGGKGFAVFTACFAYLISTAMLRSSSLFMPVIFELFFWMLFLFFVLKLITTQNTKYWIGIGISIGLGFLNKYSILFLGLSFLIAMLITNNRKLLISKHLVYSAIVCLLIVSPNLIWQVNHNFAVVTHMSELYSTQLVFVPVSTFLFEQILMNFPTLLIWLIGLFGIFFSTAERKYRVFAYTFLLIIFLFLVSKGKPYYTLGVYPMMFAFGGYYIEKIFAGRLYQVRFLILGLSFLTAVLLLPLGLTVLPAKQMEKYSAFFSKHITPAPMRSETNSYYPIPQDYMDMASWKEVAEMVSVAFNKLDSNQKKDCIIFTNNYGQAGAIDFYGKRFQLPTPICVNDSYIFWAPDSITSANFIVTDDELGDIPKLFDNYYLIGEITNYYFRENGLKVFLCQNPKPVLYDFFKKRIREHKAIYGF